MIASSYSNGMGNLDRVESRLAAALKDILARPGTLVRAIAAYFVGIKMGVAEEAARAVSCGIEYLHTASLIFDDFPAMDDAQTRRGVACIHVVYGESIATLAALALINRGYAMLWRGISHASFERRIMANDFLDERLGVHGLIGGQAHDLRGWRSGQTAAEVSGIAAKKTGDLLRLTLVLPAIIGRGTSREIHLLDRLALLRGLSYQAADDFKDIISTNENFGKTSGRDEEMGRPNLVAAEGIVATLRRFQRLNDLGDKLQACLPGPSERWLMSNLLKVSPPDFQNYWAK
ncbi:MAG: hypothetical protein HC845_10465 [Akkermansiaceae bacterium]|nr:hypothetical protein [Akkermansiaceae bacterium]